MKKIAMIFPGQGSQTIGMGKSFYEESEVAREMIDGASKHTGIDFKALLFEENETINETAYTQPAILLVSLVAYRLFQDALPTESTLFLGHSLGEFSALSASGALSYLDAVSLVHKRGALMQEACSDIDAGMMVIVGMDDDGVNAICAKAQEDGKKVWPANYNQDGQLVVAGIKGDLESLVSTFKEAGAKRALVLNMSVASHCPLLESAQEPLQKEMQNLITDNFSAPVISNVTTKAYSTKSEAVELLSEQLVKPVKYKQSILAIAPDVDMAIEFGNGKVLSGLNRRIVKELTTLNISDMDSLNKAIETLS